MPTISPKGKIIDYDNSQVTLKIPSVELANFFNLQKRVPSRLPSVNLITCDVDNFLRDGFRCFAIPRKSGERTPTLAIGLKRLPEELELGEVILVNTYGFPDERDDVYVWKGEVLFSYQGRVEKALNILMGEDGGKFRGIEEVVSVSDRFLDDEHVLKLTPEQELEYLEMKKVAGVI